MVSRNHTQSGDSPDQECICIFKHGQSVTSVSSILSSLLIQTKIQPEGGVSYIETRCKIENSTFVDRDYSYEVDNDCNWFDTPWNYDQFMRNIVCRFVDHKPTANVSYIGQPTLMAYNEGTISDDKIDVTWKKIAKPVRDHVLATYFPVNGIDYYIGNKWNRDGSGRLGDELDLTFERYDSQEKEWLQWLPQNAAAMAGIRHGNCHSINNADGSFALILFGLCTQTKPKVVIFTEECGFMTSPHFTINISHRLSASLQIK